MLSQLSHCLHSLRRVRRIGLPYALVRSLATTPGEEDDLTLPIDVLGGAGSSSVARRGASAPAPEPPLSGAGAGAAALDPLAAAQYDRLRQAIAEQMMRLKRLDAIALSHAAERSVGGVDAAALEEEGGGVSLEAGVLERGTLPEPGLPVDYCVFCYHGTRALLRVDNTALLSKFVSDGGALLPRRFTKCCAKHQRALGATLKRARAFNVLPFQGKLHPRARFTSFAPPRTEGVEGGGAGLVAGGSSSVGLGGGGGSAAAIALSALSDGSAGVAATRAAAQAVVLQELRKG